MRNSQLSHTRTIAYILNECWDEKEEHVLNKQNKETTYCSAEGCTQK